MSSMLGTNLFDAPREFPGAKGNPGRSPRITTTAVEGEAPGGGTRYHRLSLRRQLEIGGVVPRLDLERQF